MIRTIKNKISRWKLTAFAVMIPGMFVFLACQDQLKTSQTASDTKIFTVANEPVTPEGRIDQTSQKEEEVFNVVDHMPEYPGGIEALMYFIKDNLKYPLEAKQNKIHGTVYTLFIVEKDGSISDLKTLRGINASCDAEAIRIVKLLPKWTPGKHKGRVVRVRFVLPIRFKL